MGGQVGDQCTRPTACTRQVRDIAEEEGGREGGLMWLVSA